MSIVYDYDWSMSNVFVVFRLLALLFLLTSPHLLISFVSFIFILCHYRRLSFTSTHGHAPVPTLPIKKETTTPMENKNFMEATSASLSAIATNSTAMASSATSTNSKHKHMGNGKQPSVRARGGSKSTVDIATTETPRSKQHVDHDHDHQDNDHHQVCNGRRMIITNDNPS